MKGWTTGALAFMHGISRCQLLWIARSHRTGRCPHGVGNYARSPPDDLASPARPPRQARASRGHGTAHTGAFAVNAITRPVAPAERASGYREALSRPARACVAIAYRLREPATPWLKTCDRPTTHLPFVLRLRSQSSRRLLGSWSVLNLSEQVVTTTGVPSPSPPQTATHATRSR